jgi:hypothetical protein
MGQDDLSKKARALGGALEPVAGQVYFSPECHEGYEALGFNGSPMKLGVVAMPDGAAYFCSRGSVMGQVPGELISAAFAVFNPAAVVPAVDYGWTLTDANTICAARTAGAVGQLTRVLGEEPDGIDEAIELLKTANDGLRPEGRPLYAGLVSLEAPGTKVGDMWRLADQLREYRGDSHTSAWTSAGFDATEIGLMSEQYWGLPPRSYVRSRAWSDADLDAAEARLTERGLLKDALVTDRGKAEREAVEVATDRQCRRIVDNLGDRFDRLIEILLPWGNAVRDGGGYPAAGPHDMAEALRRG